MSQMLTYKSMKKRYNNKPKKCVFCGSRRIATYIYGMPAYDMSKEVEKGKIAIGGCCVGDDDPLWQCADCKHDFYLNWAPSLDLE